MGGPPAWGLGVVPTRHRKHVILLRNVHTDSRGQHSAGSTCGQLPHLFQCGSTCGWEGCGQTVPVRFALFILRRAITNVTACHRQVPACANCSDSHFHREGYELLGTECLLHGARFMTFRNAIVPCFFGIKALRPA